MAGQLPLGPGQIGQGKAQLFIHRHGHRQALSGNSETILPEIFQKKHY
jgi:hypothetical protein